MIALLIAAGGPTILMERTPWPLHQALIALNSDQGAMSRVAPGTELEINPDADVGLEVAGVGAAIYALIDKGVLRMAGAGLDARLELVVDLLRPYRKKLMSLDVVTATTLHEIAQVWRARALTAEKTWTKALESRAAMSREGTPNRRQAAATF